MQIVIDIPEEEYKMLVNSYQFLFNEHTFDNLRESIKNSTPLQKGHWKYIGNGHNGLFECDNCGAHRNMFNELEKYCYACGARMESRE